MAHEAKSGPFVDVDEVVAVRLLEGRPPGSYLVRMSSQPESGVLSLDVVDKNLDRRLLHLHKMPADVS